MDKYYTPTIEEFHVGFEFEHNFKNHPIIKDGWDKDIITGETRLKCIADYIAEKRVRVKHLSREDIEAEGWEIYSQSNVNHFTFRLPKNPDLQLHVNFGAPSKISFSTRDGLESMKFSIRNISEFRKLLTQLNIKK